ncbi:SH3 domain-containing protein [Sinorhizobium alkalisoli]|uniref:SH3 domain-containing protein n=1 Tax=Sinorhizobium alkalisoli TaxID=1752398 RepID=UPI00124E38B5
MSAVPASAAPINGRVTGLPIPRYVSLGAQRANMRVGPGTDYMVKWVYLSPGLPLEIFAEYGNWRKVRDQDGTVGWMYHGLLSGRRTGAIAPWKEGYVPMRDHASSIAPVAARLGTGLVVRLRSCSGTWCRVTGKDGGWSGYVRQQNIWGVYPGEVLP